MKLIVGLLILILVSCSGKPYEEPAESAIIIMLDSVISQSARYKGTYNQVSRVELYYRPSSTATISDISTHTYSDNLTKYSNNRWAGSLNDAVNTTDSFDFYVKASNSSNVMIFSGSAKNRVLTNGINNLSIRLSPVPVDGFDPNNFIQPRITNIYHSKRHESNHAYSVTATVSAEGGKSLSLKLTANRTNGTVMYTRTSSIMHKLGTTGVQVDNYTLTLPMNVTSISQMPDNLTMAFEVTNDLGYRTTAVVATTKVNEGEFQGISFAPVIQKYSIANTTLPPDTQGRATFEIEFEIDNIWDRIKNREQTFEITFEYGNGTSDNVTNVVKYSARSDGSKIQYSNGNPYWAPSSYEKSVVTANLIKKDETAGTITVVFNLSNGTTDTKTFPVPANLIPIEN